MPLDLQRLVGPIKVKGTIDDPLYVIVNGISIITFFKEDSATAILITTLTTIVTQSFSALTFENVVLVEVSATNYAKYFIKVNGVTIATKRSGPNLNLSFDFTGAPYALTIGDVVTVEVIHYNVGAIDAEATIFGYA